MSVHFVLIFRLIIVGSSYIVFLQHFPSLEVATICRKVGIKVWGHRHVQSHHHVSVQSQGPLIHRMSFVAVQCISYLFFINFVFFNISCHYFFFIWMLFICYFEAYCSLVFCSSVVHSWCLLTFDVIQSLVDIYLIANHTTSSFLFILFRSIQSRNWGN